MSDIIYDVLEFVSDGPQWLQAAAYPLRRNGGSDVIYRLAWWSFELMVIWWVLL
jgi:hypothetical protein